MKFMGFAVNLMAAAKPVSTFNEWNGPLLLHGQGQCNIAKSKLQPIEQIKQLTLDESEVLLSQHDLIWCDRILPDPFSGSVVNCIRYRRRDPSDTDLSDTARAERIEFEVWDI